GGGRHTQRTAWRVVFSPPAPSGGDPLKHPGTRARNEGTMLQKSRVSYDVIVVGSGASGGWAAKRLSEAGLNVALLEAGRALDKSEFREHVPSFRLEQRNRTPELLRRTRPIQAGAG